MANTWLRTENQAKLALCANGRINKLRVCNGWNGFKSHQPPQNNLATNGDQPATKQDLELLRSEVNHVHDDLVERIHDSETRLLQAFYSYVDTNNKRIT